MKKKTQYSPTLSNARRVERVHVPRETLRSFTLAEEARIKAEQAVKEADEITPEPHRPA
jgi:hypothetical protein